MKMWVSSESQVTHGETEHYKMLQTLKNEYVIAVAIEKYCISAIS